MDNRDVHKLLKEQIERTLLKSDSAWVLAAEAMMGYIEELQKTVQDHEDRLTAYDTPIEVPEEALRVDVVAQHAEEGGEGGGEQPEEEPSPEEAVEASDNGKGPRYDKETFEQAKERLQKLIDSRAAITIRERANMTIADAARSVGVSSQGFRGWEKGTFHVGDTHVSDYLALLDLLAADMEPPKVERSKGEPNGYFCEFCQRPLYGRQTRFDTKECRNSYAYIKKMNPDASNSEIRTLIASVGWQDEGRKRRKYKRLDQIKAEAARERAATSEVPSI